MLRVTIKAITARQCQTQLRCIGRGYSARDTLPHNIFCTPASSYRSFHSSASVSGRKSGGSAFEQEPRDFSKKQKMRWKKDAAKRSLLRESKGNKAQEKMLEKQVGSPEMMKFFEDARASMTDVVRDMMLPSSQSVIYSGVDTDKAEYVEGVPGLANTRIDPHVHLFDESWRNEGPADATLSLAQKQAGAGGSVYNALVDQIMTVEPERVLSALLEAETTRGGGVNPATATHLTLGDTTVETQSSGGISLASDSGYALLPSEQARSLIQPATMAIAIIRSVKEKKFEQSKELFEKAIELQIYLESIGTKGPHSAITNSATPAIDFFNNLLKGLVAEEMRTMAVKHDYTGIQELFKNMIVAGFEPDVQAWEWKILAESYLFPIEVAIASIDRLKGLKAPLTTGMHTAVLRRFFTNRDRDAVQKWWLRMHREPNLSLDEDSFLVMFNHCSVTLSSERAFWLLDEMKSRGITPSIRSYNKLIHACGTAPQHVNGYEDTVFDALCILEGAELTPNLETYNNIIHAFARGGDSRAAEYYFWEMRSKGITPDEDSYNNLLHGYARAQGVGAAKYGYRGRYARPDRLMIPTSDDMRAQQELGGVAVSKLWSEGVHYAADGDDKRNARGGKYNRGGGLVDMLDDEETQDSQQDQMRMEAGEIVRKHGTVRDQLIRTGAMDKPYGWVDPVLGKRERSKNLELAPAKEWSGGSEEEMSQTLEELAASDPELADLLAQMEDPSSGQAEASQALLARLEAEQAEEEENYKKLVEEAGSSLNDAEFEYSSSTVPSGQISRLPVRSANGTDDDLASFLDENVGRDWDNNRHLWYNWSDPFITERASYKRSKKAAMMEEKTSGLITMGSGNDNDGKADGGRDLMSALMALDGGAVPKGLFADPDGSYDRADDYIDEQWEMIEFGRAPNANYLHTAGGPRSKRLYENRVRAKKAFDELSAWMGAPPILLTHELKGMADNNICPPDHALCANDVFEDEDRPWRVAISGEARASRASYEEWLKSSSSSKSEAKQGATNDDTWGRYGNYESWHKSESNGNDENDDLYASFEGKGGHQETGNVKPSSKTLTKLLGVYAECLRDVDALTVLRAFPLYGATPAIETYRVLLRMYIRKNDIHKALALKEDMQKGVLGRPMNPDNEFFGMLIESLTHREMITDALLLLEEMSSLSIKAKDHHLRKLRVRCENLGVAHPDMPDDPLQWLKNVKRFQALSEPKSQRRTQQVQSQLYTRK